MTTGEYVLAVLLVVENLMLIALCATSTTTE